ncbi:arylamine N-acetyltransferase family protein [Pseudonocardia sp. GCM10023141]|uniref:arylamine N-acetyltransferase family protein n=1 Tax=Pseudonocardia sp. GCM10023141 TaxID=3252653 RepID=UPI003611AB5A
MTQETAPDERQDEWQVDAVDVDAYLDLIGHPRNVPPSLESLTSLHEAHVLTVPFENVDVVLGQHPGVALDSIVAKLVDQRRGGYCFENALLFAAVLERLGFTVSRRMSRVQPWRPGPATHMALVVPVDGQEHLVDVGFGSGLLRPMPLRDGAEADQAGWRHRITRDGLLWTLSVQTTRGWTALHSLSPLPQHQVDYEMAHHYVATYPKSPFTGQLVVMRLAPGVRRRLVGWTHTVEHPDGSRDERPVTPDELGAVLAELGVHLATDRVNELVRRLT